jgi:hypothetical protein
MKFRTLILLLVVAILTAVLASLPHMMEKRRQAVEAILKAEKRFSRTRAEVMKPGWISVTGYVASTNDTTALIRALDAGHIRKCAILVEADDNYRGSP